MTGCAKGSVVLMCCYQVKLWFGYALVETNHMPASKRMLVHSGDRNITGIVSRWSLGQASHGDHNESTRGNPIRQFRGLR